MRDGELQVSKLKKFLKNYYIYLLYFCILSNILNLNSITAKAATRLQDYGDELVIVIDPGHGGENEGTKENPNGMLEKEMTLITATAMRDELSKYDGVTVYMTREDDRELTLKERAEFADSVDADFMFSIHYNASESHRLYGTEVWIQSDNMYNQYGYQFGQVEVNELSNKFGLYSRGVKTKQKDDGVTDYYGILRQSAKLEVPAVIIEHCHVDNENDNGLCQSEDQLKAFGIADATAVAKYYGLSSSADGTDYSAYDNKNLAEVSEKSRVASTFNSFTAPEMCRITSDRADYETGDIKINIMTTEANDDMLYYDYSLDGGQTYSALNKWPTDSNCCVVTVNAGGISDPQVVVRAFNKYDLWTQSNVLTFENSFYTGDLDTGTEIAASYLEDNYVESNAQTFVSGYSKAFIVIMAIMLVIISIILARNIIIYKLLTIKDTDW